MENDKNDEAEDDSTTLEPVTRKEALKAIMTLNNFLSQYDKTTPELFSVLQKVRDDIHSVINYKKKQAVLISLYFDLLIYISNEP